jgi:predicted GH43/DUF377 family glycosyl hydrolase
MEIERSEVIKPRDLWWEKGGVFNPAAIFLNGKTHLLYRAVGSDHVSRFGLAVSEDGENFVQFDEPVFEGDENNRYERLGVEDPRAVQIGKDIYITYTAASVYPANHSGSFAPSLNTPSTPWRVRVSALKTRDLHQFERLGILLPNIDSKNGVLFPEKIGKYYWLLHRINPNIYLTFSTNMKGWEGGVQIMAPQEKWEEKKIGAACPPIETEKGWLLFYHGVNKEGVYSIGAALLDRMNPMVVRARTKTPLLSPVHSWEKKGAVNNVVFLTGCIKIREKLYLYYGAADTSIGLAKINTESILAALDE